MTTEIAKQEPANFLSIIDKLVGSGPIDASKMDVLERMMAMQMTIRAEERKAEYADAMSRLQAKIPQIRKDGRIVVKGVERSRYARLEDLDRAIKPLLDEEGFSFSFDEESRTDVSTTFSATLTHRNGYAETKRMTVANDKAAVGQFGPIRTAIQDSGSTVSYARRFLIKMMLNIVETDEDNDGNDERLITEEQARDLQCILEGCKASVPNFLEMITGTKTIAEIPASQWSRVLHAAEVKAGKKK